MSPIRAADPFVVLALSLAVGGDCLADVAVLRDQPNVFGPVASDPTVSRLVDTLAADARRALAAIDTARAATRAGVWSLAGEHAPNHAASVDDPVILDLDATLLTSHSDKEQTAPTFKRGFGFHPLLAFVDQGEHGTGEPLSFLLRRGNAGSNTAAAHIAVARAAFAQLPGHRPGRRPGKSVLVRTDGAGCTHAFVDWWASQRVQYSVGFTLPDLFTAQPAVLDQAGVWQPALDAGQQVRPEAVVADATRSARPHGLTEGHAGDRPQGETPSRGTTSHHRRQRLASHRVHHQHPRRRRTPPRLRPPRTAAPPPRPLRGPNQDQQGQRTDQPATARLRPEPDLARDRRPRRRAHRLVPAARPHRPPRAALGAETATAVLRRGRLADHGRTRRPHLATAAPWARLLLTGLERLHALPT